VVPKEGFLGVQHVVNATSGVPQGQMAACGHSGGSVGAVPLALAVLTMVGAVKETGALQWYHKEVF